MQYDGSPTKEPIVGAILPPSGFSRSFFYLRNDDVGTISNIHVVSKHRWMVVVEHPHVLWRGERGRLVLDFATPERFELTAVEFEVSGRLVRNL